MERTIDLQLEELKKTILEMGGYVEKALKIAIDGLLKQARTVSPIGKFNFPKSASGKQPGK